MDSKNDTLRIVDYKTGGTPKTPENIEQLFTPADNRPSYIFQTFLYRHHVPQTNLGSPSCYTFIVPRQLLAVIEMGAPRQPKNTGL